MVFLVLLQQTHDTTEDKNDGQDNSTNNEGDEDLLVFFKDAFLFFWTSFQLSQSNPKTSIFLASEFEG